MDKTFKRLFLTNLTVILGGLFLFGILLSIPSAQWPLLLGLGVALALGLSFVIGKKFFKPIQHLQRTTLNQMSAELQNKISEIMQDKNELQAILSGMVEGVLVIGKNEKILLLNPPVYEMLDLRSKDILGRPYWEVIRNEEINSLLKEALAQKKSIKKDITIISPDDSQFSTQVSSILLDSGELSGVVAVFHDITEFKKLARLRSEFVANVSHELKTPLTSIKGFVETLQSGALKDPENGPKFLSIIQKHTERLEHLVNDLLSLSAIESKEAPLTLESIQLLSFLESVVNLFEERTQSKNHPITLKVVPNLPPILLDRVKMEHAFLNLLDNAVKFTPAGGPITVNAAKENGSVRIDINDSGIGIAEEHWPRIFERFYRVDKGRSREVGGTGLGLAIVKHIVLAHNGQVRVHSRPGQGSTFSIYLPIFSS